MQKLKRFLSFILILFVVTNVKAQYDFQEHIIVEGSDIADDPNDILSVDIDGDGDMDVLSATHYKINWYENLDGSGTFGPQQIINHSTDAISLNVADIDGDGDLDIASASFNGAIIAWYENTDGQGTFVFKQSLQHPSNYANAVYLADIDGDGDMDVLAAYATNIGWFENMDGQGTFGEAQTIHSDSASLFSMTVSAADLDSDDDLDVLAISSYAIAWYENLDGQGNFGVEQRIDNAVLYFLYANNVFALDMDIDGDNDLLTNSSAEGKVTWYENTDGLGSFGTKHFISVDIDGPSNSVYPIDFDRDGDLDVVSSHYQDEKLMWFENLDGLANFNTSQIIAMNNRFSHTYAVDINNDELTDVLTASSLDDKIAWYENLGALSIYEFDLNEVSIFPNPTDNQLTIKSKRVINKVSVYDINGRLLNDKTLSNSPLEFKLDVSHLSNGLYFLEIQSTNSKQTQKFIKD